MDADTSPTHLNTYTQLFADGQSLVNSCATHAIAWFVSGAYYYAIGDGDTAKR